jgi:galactokinase
MRIASVFQKQFGAAPAVVTRAPGRVNLIGEHIDYSGGHVLPAAIGFAIRIAASPRGDGRFRLYAVQYEERFEGELPRERIDDCSWANYLFGVVHEFGKLGHAVKGMDAVIDGDIPRASGLSSSAAFEVAAAWAVQRLLGASLSRMEIALLGQRAENRFVGVNCGIMDQAISAGGQAGHAMLLDCNTLQATQIPLDFRGEAAILVAHSGVRRGLSASAYNQRRSKCDAALEVIRRETGKNLACLCDAALEDLEAARSAMDDETIKRARHAITEEARVRQAADALRSGDLERMGALLDASHESLRDDYEVSCGELDELTEMIRSHAGAYGSRLTGAGFGGCAVSLVRTDAANDIIEELEEDYYRTKGFEPILFLSEACNGVEVLDA